MSHSSEKKSNPLLHLIFSILLLLVFFGKIVPGCRNSKKGTKKSNETEVHIVVTRQDNGAEVYNDLTPWKGAVDYLVDIKVVSSPEQCGRSVKVSCTSWSEDFYLVACSKVNVNFPIREFGKPVYVSAVK